MGMGLTYLHLSDSYLGQSQTYSGGGFTMDFAAGGSVSPNFVIFGAFSIASAINPTRSSGGQSTTLTNTDMNLMAFGPGVAYYLMPLNMHFSGTLMFSQVTADDTTPGNSNSSIDVTEMGVGASFMAGKDWWVSSNWGIGVSTILHVASMKVKDYDARMTATSISALFTATYN